MAQYSFSYSLQRRFRKRVILITLCICALLLVSKFIQSNLFFSVYTYSDSAEAPSNLEMCFVSPLASPIAENEQTIPIISSVLHSVKLQRGNVVYIAAQQEKEVSFFSNLIEGFLSFITFNQVSPFFDSTTTAEKPAIRRLLALPGDTVYMQDYVLYVKPAGEQHFLTEFELTDEQYDITINELPENWDIDLGTNGRFEPFLLRTDEYFVLSDNRTETTDSRLWGPVRASRIDGRVFFRFFPFSRAAFL